MKGRGEIRSDDGVSETIGFIIIFGIVLTGIAIVTLYGYPALMQEQENANIKNMEKNMLVLQSDLKTLTHKNVPYQETTIQVSGGTLSVKEDPDPSWPYFTIDIPGHGTIPHLPGELKFISGNGDANIVLENGAVHLRYWYDPQGSVMLSDPSWFYDSATNTYVVHLIKLNAASDFAQSGIGTVRMQMSGPSSTQNYTITGPVTISYQADPSEDYMVAWKNYFESPDLKMTFNSTASTWPAGRLISYDLDSSAKEIVVKKYNVTILSL
jgi:hypothetical protein